MAARAAYRTSGDGALRSTGHCDIGIGEMTAVSTDHCRQLPPERRDSGFPPGRQVVGVSVVSTEELAALDVFADIPAQDLAALAAHLQPLRAAAGEVLMHQGAEAESFSIITSGRVEIRHVTPEGQVAVTELSPDTIVGEIALLRGEPRTATVIAKDDVRGFVGYEGAFECMLAIPVVADRMVRTARQRLVA